MYTILTAVYVIGALMVLIKSLLDLAIDFNDIAMYAGEDEEGKLVYYIDLAVFIAGSTILWPLTVAQHIRRSRRL